MLDLLLKRVGLLAVILAISLAGSACSDDDKPVPDSAVPDSGLDAVAEGGADGTADATSQEQKLVILHTNDLHEHLMGFGPNADYAPASTGDGTKGGFARLATKIKAERAAATSPLLLLDSGDFLMGSIFTWLDADKAPTMTLLQDLGYDAVTLGNHEFDWTIDGLVLFLDAAVKAGFKVPIVASNLVFDASDPGDDKLEAFVKDGTIVTKLVKTLDNGLKVGIFGLMGADAAGLSASAPLGFEVDSDDKTKIAAVAKAMVKELREQDKVDLVICLSHSGIKADGTGEDADLAAGAPGIDVILSGHDHVELKNPVEVGETLILQTGKYGANLGKLVLTFKEGKIASHAYELIALDDQVTGDDGVQKKIDGYIQEIDDLLKPAQLSYNTVIAETAFDLAFPFYIKDYYTETILGNVVTDAFIQVYNALYPGEPADCAIESQGTVRDPVLKGKTGKLWLADLYRATPLGVGFDGTPGYPLVSFYLHGRDLKSVMELLPLSKSMRLPYFFAQVGGMQVEYQANGIPTMSVDSIKINGQEVNLYDTTTCYKVVTNLVLAKSLAAVEAASQGVLKVEPKEQDCTTVVTDMSTRIVDADPATPALEELKAWQALVKYMQSFPDTNSNQIPDVPSSYATLQDRIVAK